MAQQLGVFLLENSQFGFPAPTLGGSQSLYIYFQGNLVPSSGFCGHLHICDAYKYIQADIIIKPKKILKIGIKLSAEDYK
jgi:hypothetical protein